MRACELSALLAQDAEGVAQHLLPNGRKHGREWVVGDVDGSAGESLKVCVQGTKAGVWKDFATDEGGDLIGLWMVTRGVDLRQACDEAMAYLSITPTKLEPAARKTYAKPSRDGVSAVSNPLLQWLREVRKLPEESIRAYRVAAKGGALMFPSLVEGELLAAKYRAAPEKKFWTDADCQPVLFGWQAIDAAARAVTICEGELDAIALHAYGYPALSVPFGGGGGDKQRWIESEFDRLAVFDRINLCLDADDAGHEATQVIAERLGRERCHIVTLPHKDANACLIAGIPQTDIAACFESARTMDPDKLRNAGSYAEAVVAEFGRVANGEAGIWLPWRKVQDAILLRPGETSVWAGINGHGKSMVAQQVLLGAMSDGHRCCAASLEFLPHKWLRRLTRQAAAEAFPSDARIRHTIHAMGETLWLYEAHGSAHLDDILSVFGYAAKRYGVALFLIDNFAKLSIAEDDYQAHKLFMDRVSDFSRDHNVHVMVVAHTRKTEKGESKPPEKGDVKGSGAITDLADTVIAVWRNKPKEAALSDNPYDPDAREKPDCLLVCHKQRNGESEPAIKLWFDHKSQQYVEEPGLLPEPMLGMRVA